MYRFNDRGIQILTVLHGSYSGNINRLKHYSVTQIRWPTHKIWARSVQRFKSVCIIYTFSAITCIPTIMVLTCLLELRTEVTWPSPTTLPFRQTYSSIWGLKNHATWVSNFKMSAFWSGDLGFGCATHFYPWWLKDLVLPKQCKSFCREYNLLFPPLAWVAWDLTSPIHLVKCRFLVPIFIL